MRLAVTLRLVIHMRYRAGYEYFLIRRLEKTPRIDKDSRSAKHRYIKARPPIAPWMSQRRPESLELAKHDVLFGFVAEAFFLCAVVLFCLEVEYVCSGRRY